MPGQETKVGKGGMKSGDVAYITFNLAIVLTALILSIVYNHKELKRQPPMKTNPAFNEQKKWYYWPGMIVWAWFGITFIILLARCLVWYAVFLWNF